MDARSNCYFLLTTIHTIGVTTVKTIRLSSTLAVIAAASLFCSTAAVAQQDDDGGPLTQGDDAVYISITFVDYKPGKRSDALQIIDEHFAPASEAAGLQGPMAIHFQTGQWDAAFHWRLENGMVDLEWFRSPDDVEWMEAMVAQEGSEDAAEAIIASYVEKIARTDTVVGHRHIPEEEQE